MWSGLGGIVIIGLLLYSAFGGQGSTVPTFVVAEKGDIRQEVSVTGNVKPLTEVNLAFERGGRVASIAVAVNDQVVAGQYLASVSNADLLAALDQARAGLKKAQAGYNNGTDQTTLGFTQAQSSLYNAIKDSYTKADDAVRNKMYTLFTDAARYQAKLSFSTDVFLQEDIEDGKDKVTDTLEAWSRSLGKMTATSSLETYYQTAGTNLEQVKSLLDKCALAVNGLDSGTYAAASLETWKTNISSARSSVNLAIDNLKTIFDAYKTATLSVKLSGNDLLAKEALVEEAQAGVASAEAEIAKTIIRSPLSGVITALDVKLGEIVSANKTVLTVISQGDYEVESFVPEADIAKIKIANSARTTLDAYGDSVIFTTTVIKIDPAATVIDGVPTYKVTLRFDSSDERVRAGMTANLDILTAAKEDVLRVPTRAVYTKDGSKYVKLLTVDNVSQEVKVEAGLRGSDGMIEILSGITAGDKVVTAL